LLYLTTATIHTCTLSLHDSLPFSSLHQMLEQLLFRYAYVYYPFLPSSEDAIHISEALKVVGEEYLNIKGMANEDSRSERKEYVQAIKTGNLLYSSVLVE